MHLKSSTYACFVQLRTKWETGPGRGLFRMIDWIFTHLVNFLGIVCPCREKNTTSSCLIYAARAPLKHQGLYGWHPSIFTYLIKFQSTLNYLISISFCSLICAFLFPFLLFFTFLTFVYLSFLVMSFWPLLSNLSNTKLGDDVNQPTTKTIITKLIHRCWAFPEN